MSQNHDRNRKEGENIEIKHIFRHFMVFEVEFTAC